MPAKPRNDIVVTVSEKFCPSCKLTKAASEFYRMDRCKTGLKCYCKVCQRAEVVRTYPSRRDAILTKSREAYWSDPRKWSEYRKKIRSSPAGQERSRREYQKRKLRIVTDEQKTKQREWRRAYRLRRSVDINSRIETNLRRRIYRALKGKVKKSDKTIKLLGCSVDNFKIYLESRFEPGMSWDNYGNGFSKWNIEHEIPCAIFDFSRPEHQRVCFHFSNQRPMWQPDNSRKRDKVTPEIMQKFTERLAEQSA